jgi:glyoxylase-like metal-dependent hydrolase (beta-lactamase superfamily II)
LSENLWVFEDCCNVYIIRQGRGAALVNFGTGTVLRQLARVGVDHVDRVLVTHHHRDQVQGLADLVDYPFSVIVPRGEARFFEDVESFWNHAQIYVNYDLRSSWNTLRQSVNVRQKVGGGDARTEAALYFCPDTSIRCRKELSLGRAIPSEEKSTAICYSDVARTT